MPTALLAHIPFKTITGYPSIDKPWLKYYGKASDTSELPSPDCSLDAFLRECSKHRLDNKAVNDFGTSISFRSLFEQIDNRCRDELPESHIHDEYIFVEDFPLTRAGKIDYRALEDMAEKNDQ